MRHFLILIVLLTAPLDLLAASVTSVGPMTVARNGATATLLPDGTVLIAGGVDAAPGTPRQEEIYDPHARSFRATAGMEVQRVGHAAATLQDGRILLVGGFESSTANSEIYDPAAVRFSNMVSISGERYQPSAAALADGRVLVAGGKRSSTRIATAEIFIPTERRESSRRRWRNFAQRYGRALRSCYRDLHSARQHFDLAATRRPAAQWLSGPDRRRPDSHIRSIDTRIPTVGRAVENIHRRGRCAAPKRIGPDCRRRRHLVCFGGRSGLLARNRFPEQSWSALRWPVRRDGDTSA